MTGAGRNNTTPTPCTRNDMLKQKDEIRRKSNREAQQNFRKRRKEEHERLQAQLESLKAENSFLKTRDRHSRVQGAEDTIEHGFAFTPIESREDGDLLAESKPGCRDLSSAIGNNITTKLSPPPSSTSRNEFVDPAWVFAAQQHYDSRPIPPAPTLDLENSTIISDPSQVFPSDNASTFASFSQFSSSPAPSGNNLTWAHESFVEKTVNAYDRCECFAIQAAKWWEHASQIANRKALLFRGMTDSQNHGFDFYANEFEPVTGDAQSLGTMPSSSTSNYMLT